MMGIGKRSQLRSLKDSLKVTHNRPIDHAILMGQVARLIVTQKGTRSQFGLPIASCRSSQEPPRSPLLTLSQCNLRGPDAA
jgi:hypothetical protein